ncbi:MAG: hypothetical protein HQL89_10990 [Magnetococcales bacterium]|nr:hypothetical protein [Magnetococcales bacterium]
MSDDLEDDRKDSAHQPRLDDLHGDWEHVEHVDAVTDTTDEQEEAVVVREDAADREEPPPSTMEEISSSPLENEARQDHRPVSSRSGRGERRILGIRLQGSSMVYRLVAGLPDLTSGDRLLVQTREGESEGQVVFVSNTVYSGKNDPRKPYPGRIVRIVRKLGEKEAEQGRDRLEKELKAKVLGRELIRQAQLPMKLSRVIYQPGGTKAIFYFTSESRIDFRDLVKTLSDQLGIRVEMRHVGVRDETRMLGGVGHCGKDFCCSQYLQKFHPVSVRMAKNQDLSLNPDGISGVCGRLMCCLAYENDTYVHLRESLPSPKNSYWTRDGREVVIRSVQPLRGNVTCQFADGTRENCPATDLLPERPATAQVPSPQEPLEEPREEEVVLQTPPVVTEPEEIPRMPEEGVERGEPKRRSRKKRNRKKSSAVQGVAGAVEAMDQRERQGDLPSMGHEAVVGAGDRGNTPHVAKKRRRRRKKPSGPRETPAPTP